MKFNRFFWFILFSISIVFCVICWEVPFSDIYNLPNNLIVEDVDEPNLGDFGSLVNATYNKQEHTVDYKLLNTVTLHSAKTIEGKKQVYLGGDTLGFSYYGDGVLVVSNNGLGRSNENFLPGDIIKSINDIPVTKISKISEILKENRDKEITVKIVRNKNVIEQRLKPAYDVLSQKYKLGIWAREGLSGIGTLTFVDQQGRFGALGHPILEQTTGTALGVSTGEVHKCSVLGVKKAQRGSPGEIKGVFVRSKSEVGSVDENCDFGIYGKLNLENEMFANKQLVEVGGRLSAKPGKALIYSCIDGKNIRPYEIEIIKTNYQGASSPKNLVFKVTDKRLIEITGGIVQGMSGSPIVQDGKLIGAVTHVFVNDPTKGFGIYIDTMLAH